NLAVWFALHTLFADLREVWVGGVRFWLPDWRSLDVPSLVLAVAAAVALFRFKAGMLPTLAGSALAGCAYRLIL
ncbi:MAG TPA: chromate transporter, partial [Methylomirabilota bacterium]|nr:chromate transporter [Methylomirabilota bacterium]